MGEKPTFQRNRWTPNLPPVSGNVCPSASVGVGWATRLMMLRKCCCIGWSARMSGAGRGVQGVSRGVTRVTTAGGPHIRSGIAEQESASGDMQGNIIFIFFLFGHHRKSVLTWRRVAPRPAVIWSRDWCLDSARRNPPHCREKKSPAVAR